MYNPQEIVKRFEDSLPNLDATRSVKFYSGTNPNIVTPTKEEVEKSTTEFLNEMMNIPEIKQMMEDDFKYFLVYGESRPFNAELLNEMYDKYYKK